MAREAQNLRPPPFHFSDLGPCELSWFEKTDDRGRKLWIFWSRKNDELQLHHHQRTPLLASNNGDPTMKEKIKRALRGLHPSLVNSYLKDGSCLIQFWGLVNIGDRKYLTTCDQPFTLVYEVEDTEEDPGKRVEGLCRYRKHCLEYLIAVDQEGELGPPGRVFLSGSPEFILDVRRYSREEYPPRDLAVKYVKRYYAMPVYQSPDHICIGVLEFVYPDDPPVSPWRELADRLKEVGLTTNHPVWLSDSAEEPSSCHNREINEIAKVLNVVCERHNIPIAQMWMEANSKQQLTIMCRSSCEGYSLSECMDAYSVYCLPKGHGVVGKAFSSQRACFCRNIRKLSITEYPFVPNARNFGFSSCFAICLQSSYSDSCICVLEFLLPKNEAGSGVPMTLLRMIMETLKQSSQHSFTVAPGKELGQNLVVEVIKVSPNDELDSFEICHATSGESTHRIAEV